MVPKFVGTPFLVVTVLCVVCLGYRVVLSPFGLKISSWVRSRPLALALALASALAEEQPHEM